MGRHGALQVFIKSRDYTGAMGDAKENIKAMIEGAKAAREAAAAEV